MSMGPIFQQTFRFEDLLKYFHRGSEPVHSHTLIASGNLAAVIMERRETFATDKLSSFQSNIIRLSRFRI